MLGCGIRGIFFTSSSFSLEGFLFGLQMFLKSFLSFSLNAGQLIFLSILVFTVSLQKKNIC